MEPVKFTGCNAVLGAGQEGVRPLPCLQIDSPMGEIYVCWQLTDEEVAEIVRTRQFFTLTHTFKQAFQPLLPMVNLSDNILILRDNNGA